MKYTIDELKKIDSDSRIAYTNLMIANEINELKKAILETFGIDK